MTYSNTTYNYHTANTLVLLYKMFVNSKNWGPAGLIDLAKMFCTGAGVVPVVPV